MSAIIPLISKLLVNSCDKTASLLKPRSIYMAIARMPDGYLWPTMNCYIVDSSMSDMKTHGLDTNTKRG